jgi:hypothetical protein
MLTGVRCELNVHYSDEISNRDFMLDFVKVVDFIDYSGPTSATHSGGTSASDSGASSATL